MASRPSHEASTADEALALGRAEHGPDADLRVREIRTGGVGGFFATRRFVAELAADIEPDTDERHADGTDADLDAAIADAAAALGTGPVTAPTRQLAAVASRRDPRASRTPVHPFSPAAAASSDTSAQDQTTKHSTSAPASASPAPASPAPASPVPASPFAMALSRMANGPEVTAAVMDVMDGTTGATGAGGRVTATVQATPGRVVLYSVPQAAPVTDAGDDPDESIDTAETSAAAPALTDYNYAAMLVGGRSPFPSAAPAPSAGVEPTGETTGETITVEPDVTVATALSAAIPHVADPTGLLPRMAAIGFPAHLIPDLFLHDVAEKGVHAALTRLLKMRTVAAPALPAAPCTVVVVGPGTEALTAAMNACEVLRADAAQVAWVGPAHLSNMVPAARRLSTPEAATKWLAAPKRATVVNVIAVHSPVNENIDPYTRAILAALDPTMVLAVVDATRKVESVTRWVEALDCVDALALENVSDTHDPAAWLTFAGAPVALVEGRKITAARWASLLCERITDLADMEG